MAKHTKIRLGLLYRKQSELRTSGWLKMVDGALRVSFIPELWRQRRIYTESREMAVYDAALGLLDHALVRVDELRIEPRRNEWGGDIEGTLTVRARFEIIPKWDYSVAAHIPFVERSRWTDVGCYETPCNDADLAASVVRNLHQHAALTIHP
jgi:hypothetical protein